MANITVCQMSVVPLQIDYAVNAIESRNQSGYEPAIPPSIILSYVRIMTFYVNASTA